MYLLPSCTYFCDRKGLTSMLYMGIRCKVEFKTRHLLGKKKNMTPLVEIQDTQTDR